MSNTIKVWDVSIRLFHWLLMAAIIFCWWSARQSDMLEWHMRSGYLVLGLLSYRVIWGLVGSRYARFSHFIYGPKRVFTYLASLIKGQEQRYLSHNPLGSLAVIALIVFVGIQAGTGLFANDDIFLEGPLAQYVSSATSSALTSFHKQWFDALLILTGLHVLAVLFHQIFRKEKLVQGMITGKKSIEDAADK